MSAPAPPSGPSPSAPEAPPTPPAPEAPLSHDMLHTEVRGLMAINSAFDGARLFLSQPAGQHMNLQHQFHLGREKSYHFAPTYVGTLNQLSPQESYPIIMADMDNNGSLLAQCVHHFTPAWKSRVQVQTDGPKYVGVQAETEYAGRNWSSGLKLINIDLIRGSGFLTLNYLQNVTKRLAMGAEYLYQYGAQGEMGTASFSGRYRTKEWTATGTISPRGVVQASYFHQFSSKVAGGSDFDFDLRSGEARASIGVQYSFRQSVFRSQITSRGEVAGVLEKQLAPGVTFLLSGVMNHAKGESVFGFGLNVGQ